MRSWSQRLARIVRYAGFLASLVLAACPLVRAQQAAPPTQAAALKQAVGTIKSISGNRIVLAPDNGAEVNVAVTDTAKIVRMAPGQTDLKTATAIQLSDLVAGDRVLVRGHPSDDGTSLNATGVIAMKRSDVEAKQQHDREDWQRRGIGGLVSAVDPAAGTITISVAALGGPKTVLIHAGKETVLKRYAPNSVQFDDATPGSIDQIRSGDQLRARGTRSADGGDFAAEEIVSGAFRNISGTIISVDTAGHMLVVADLVTKKPVTVNLTAQSQVVKLPPQLAQGLAMRLKGGAEAGGAAGAAARGGDLGTAAGTPGDVGARRAPGGGGAGGGRGGGDLQQIVNRLPAAALTDFQKGDAVMIVSTEGTASGVTAITMVGGVEPILTAPNGQQSAMTLSPWNIGGGGGEDQGGGTQ